ncbi:MAG: DUF423 domain-containing protein [Anaerolineae bacterium]|nr:DUF423 domain-containing protein [Anaerolineae bacterium]
MSRTFIILSTILGFTGVALGAFGAHGLQATLEANGRTGTFETASRYQMYHALALIGVAWLMSIKADPFLTAAGWTLFAGALIFSGALYVLAIFDVRIMGAVAPIGGLLMLIGWACMGIGAWRVLSA